MSFLFGKSETRSLNVDAFGTGASWSPWGGGMKSALRVAPVYAATGMIADSISVLPAVAYERGPSGARQRMEKQPLLVTNPHPLTHLTRVEWLHQFAVSYLLRGNAYGVITKIDSRGTPEKIAWLNPDGVTVDESSYLPKYFYNGTELDLATVVHVPGYAPPGTVVGLSPIELFRRQLETSSSAVDYGRDWFRNGAAPSGHLKYGKPQLDQTASARAKAQFKAAVANADLFVSGSDWTWEALSVKPEEAQFLQTIKAGAGTIASIYHVDPNDIGGESPNSLTYSTVELNQIKYQVQALLPIYTRLEHHVSRLLLPSQYLKFNADASIRTDLKTRMEAHEISLRAGLETNPEGRALEDRLPLTEDEIAAWQKNYKTVGAPMSTPAAEARTQAELIQKIYLGVGVVISEDEAREILKSAGIKLDPGSFTANKNQNGGTPDA